MDSFEPASAALLVVDNFTVLGTPGWANGSASIQNDTNGAQMFGISMNLFKRLNHKIMVCYLISFRSYSEFGSNLFLVTDCVQNL
jgi:hypothetical protein